MDEVESRLAAILGLSRAGNLPVFDAISPILNQNESLVSKDMRAATAATANFLRLIVKKLSKFDLGQEWVQEAKLQSNELLLQEAISARLEGAEALHPNRAAAEGVTATPLPLACGKTFFPPYNRRPLLGA